VTREDLTRRSIVSQRTPRGGTWLVAWVALAGSGCDLVQGYQDAGDALFPEQSTHLVAPGLRLAPGSFTELDAAAGSEVYLLARDADDATGKLISMRYADPRPCEIPGVGRYSATQEPSRSAPLISYFESDTRRGTLRFADTRCRNFSLSFEDARLPLSETEQGVVVWAGSDLWLALPENDSQTRLASDVTTVVSGVFGGRHAVVAGGRLLVFDERWHELGAFGNDVASLERAGRSLFYVDSVGVHRIVGSASESSGLASELLAKGACSLGHQGDPWVTVQSPCESGDVLAIHEPTGRSFTLPFEADASSVELVPTEASPGNDPLEDPFWFFYLRTNEAEGTENSLFARTPSGQELALGDRATLRQLRLVESESETYGYALVDVSGDTGRYIWWNEAGEIRELASDVMWRPSRLIVDFDGALGSVAVASGDRLVVLAERVPWNAFEFNDSTDQWSVLFHDVQERGAGRLSVFAGGIDALESTPSGASLQPPELTPVASNVIAYGTSSLDHVLPGVLYLTDFDLAKGTGRLEYRNLELRFTAKVNAGVGSYLVANDEILYAIPHGPDAGIWLASAK
jgi:hypothetical protein